ncbi:MAG: hypothetical protein PHG66_05555 [Candidatus Colwellbacteria bacterium]|nr:hypothetical protein [Candidatus Colwellbacteria bacterium]
MSEYRDWVVSYKDYLVHMYESIFLQYLTRKEKKIVTFEMFCKFVYSNSSGEIVDYL